MRKIIAALCPVLLASCATTSQQELEMRDVAVFTRPQLTAAVKEKSHLFQWTRENVDIFNAANEKVGSAQGVKGERKLSREEVRSLIDAMDTARRSKGRHVAQREGDVKLTCRPEQCAVSFLFTLGVNRQPDLGGMAIQSLVRGMIVH